MVLINHFLLPFLLSITAFFLTGHIFSVFYGNCNILQNDFETPNSIRVRQEPLVCWKEDVESPTKLPQVPEEQNPSWDSKTYGEPMWKRGDLALELD